MPLFSVCACGAISSDPDPNLKERGIFYAPGWVEALQLMPEGAKWKLYIPSELAYGAQGAGEMIPPHSTLIFEVELLKVLNK